MSVAQTVWDELHAMPKFNIYGWGSERTPNSKQSTSNSHASLTVANTTNNSS